jgi:diguanylate cyclase (GGDEF)-like protein
MRHSDLTWRWVLSRGVAIRDANGTPTRMAGSLSDITLRHEAEERLLHDALHDALTGLPNRALFMDRLEQALRRIGRRENERIAVLFADLDGFKLINDSHDHTTGDRLLVAIARRFKAALRPADTVARLGGDEFTVLLDGVESTQGAEAVAVRLLDSLRAPFWIDGHAFAITTSVGIAMSDEEITPAELLRNADIAMYDAKRRGRSHHALFDRRMHTRVVSRVSLESRLRQAIDHRRVRTFLQPIVDLDSGRVVALEALARWPEGEATQILPTEFIPVAEETGLISQLGRQVMSAACTTLAGWRDRGIVTPDVVINVNLSPSQLADPGLHADVEEVLACTGLPGEALRLELTESTLAADPERMRLRLRRLQQLGVGIQLDDFGTGQSSLTLLHQFPGDTIKMDRLFVSSIAPGDRSHVIARAIIDLAHGLGMEVIAEGVEHAHQVQLLRGLKCRFAQGYFFSVPLPLQDAEALLVRWNAPLATAV